MKLLTFEILARNTRAQTYTTIITRIYSGTNNMYGYTKRLLWNHLDQEVYTIKALLTNHLSSHIEPLNH